MICMTDSPLDPRTIAEAEKWASYTIARQHFNRYIKLLYLTCRVCGKEQGPVWTDYKSVKKLGVDGKCWTCRRLTPKSKV